MSAKVYSIPGQTEEKRKTFFETKRIDLFYELSLTSGVNINYYKCVHYAIPTRKNGERPGNF